MKVEITKSKTLCMLNGSSIHKSGDELYCHASFGKLINELSRLFREVNVCVHESIVKQPEHDLLLSSNVTFTTLPTGGGAVSGLLNGRKCSLVYEDAIKNSDFVFVRGILTPAVSSLYYLCSLYNKPVIHWLPGNPMALISSHRRGGFFKDLISRYYIKAWEKKLHLGHNKCLPHSFYLCNGNEIADRHPSINSETIISTTLSESDFYHRVDTCLQDDINISVVCYIRPEKGLEYLIKAIPLIKVKKNIKLNIYGSRDRYEDYQKKLNQLIFELNLEETVRFHGHCLPQNVPKSLRNSDIFILPTLSEGTPRVVIEAKSNSVPVIATAVGGIPDSIEHGYDGLLVPPKDSEAIAKSIDKILIDSKLRRKLIHNGYNSTLNLTVDNFAKKILVKFNEISLNEKVN